MKEKADVVRPTLEVARQAQASGLTIRDFVLSRLPKEILKAAE